MNFLLNLLTGPLITAVVGVLGKYITAGVDKEKLHQEVELAIIKTLGEVTNAQADVIKAEINSEERLTRLWRPITALSFSFVIVFYVLLLPIAVDWFGAPPVRTGDKILEWTYQLVTVCLGGYVVGRSLETIAKTIIGRWR